MSHLDIKFIATNCIFTSLRENCESTCFTALLHDIPDDPSTRWS